MVYATGTYLHYDANHCCGSGSASASNKNTDQDPHTDPLQSDKMDPEPDPDPHQFADGKTKCMYMSLF